MTVRWGIREEVAALMGGAMPYQADVTLDGEAVPCHLNVLEF